MTEREQWHQGNACHLAQALAGLRQRLENQAGGTERDATSRTSDSDHSGASGTLSHQMGEGRGEGPVHGQGEHEGNALPETTNFALQLLAQRLGLSGFEKDVLLLCAAMELDTRIPDLCARAQGDPQKPFPTFALALTLFDNPAWDVLSPERPLRYYRLIEVHQSGTLPLTASPLRADERVVHHLKGLDYLDERLAGFCAPIALPEPALLAPSQSEMVESILRRLLQTPETARVPVVQLLGPDAASKQLIASHAAAKLGRHLHRLSIELLPAPPADLVALARLWQRESLLLPLALYLDAQELDAATADKAEVLGRFLTRSDGLIFLGVREPFTRSGSTASLLVDAAKPTPAEQQTAWAEALGSTANGSAARLAGQFNLNLGSVRELSRLARAETEKTTDKLAGKAWELCCTHERPCLDALAQRLEPKATWDDLVLPKTETALLWQIAAQVHQRQKVYGEWGFERKMSRGFSISALFAGPSGTGKTMAAEVMASDLRLNLYRIDLSAVVSKYVGETEKNLRRLFDAAEDGGAILFFDEADSLFGKRSEVKDSHDRYANIEINYLLQRIESYRGLAILATNMKSALDTAFLRRLRFVVNFPFPSLAERRRLWEKAFPAADSRHNLRGTPVELLDYDSLARLDLTGGHIHNVALNAAFLAAAANTPVTMPLLLEAARVEFQKLDRPVNAADFQWPGRNGSQACSATIGRTVA